MSERDFYERYWKGDMPHEGMFEEPPVWDDASLREKLDPLVPYLRGKWLDLGCGAGQVTHALSRYVRATGVDVSQAAVKKAKKSYPGIVFRRAEGQRLPFRKGAFDGVVAFDVAEHVLDTDALFAEIARVVRPGGYVCLTTTELTRIKLLYIALFRLHAYFFPTNPHVRYYTRRTLARVLERHGFSVVHYGRDGAWMGFIPKGQYVIAQKRA